jgi:uncharacterized protein YegL
MSVDGKIDVLNDAISRMIAAFQKLTMPGCEVALTVISFGGVAATHLNSTLISEVSWKPLGAAGTTPMGDAFRLASQILKDESATPTRSFHLSMENAHLDLRLESDQMLEWMCLPILQARTVK